MKNWLNPIAELTPWKFWTRVVWVSVQLLITYFFLSNDDPFFYQGF